ncbi:MAG TPA: polysaccharide biosynthesis/export family protein [Vicinamibacteria bacterium]|jgi:polysaccharide export outer membrane protein
MTGRWCVASFLAVASPLAVVAQGNDVTGGPAAGAASSEYRIGPEDVLHVIVWQNTDLTRVVPVRPDGRISLPLVNDVQAAGLTPMQLREVLKEKLADYVAAAEISVIVAEVQSFSVSVLGKVQSPGRYKLKSPTSVLDVLALAGGFQEFADTDRIVILRPQAAADGKAAPGAFKRLSFNYKRVITAGGESENLALQPGDIVVVP